MVLVKNTPKGWDSDKYNPSSHLEPGLGQKRIVLNNPNNSKSSAVQENMDRSYSSSGIRFSVEASAKGGISRKFSLSSNEPVSLGRDTWPNLPDTVYGRQVVIHLRNRKGFIKNTGSIPIQVVVANSVRGSLRKDQELEVDPFSPKVYQIFISDTNAFEFQIKG